LPTLRVAQITAHRSTASQTAASLAVAYCPWGWPGWVGFSHTSLSLSCRFVYTSPFNTVDEGSFWTSFAYDTQLLFCRCWKPSWDVL